MSRLALFLLGPPRIECNGEPVEIRRRKAMALIVYLAVTGRSHSRDALATLLWPEHDQSRARAGLRRALAALKKALRQALRQAVRQAHHTAQDGAQDAALGEGWLDVDRETVGLNPGAEVWLDVAEFQDRLAECRTHGHLPEEVCPACLPLLAEAAALYCDHFLAGFTLRDSPGFDEWQFFQTEGLRDELASALERLAHGYSDRGEFERAIACARRWLALDPLREPAHRHLMRLYAWSGQRAAALRQYGGCERVLRKELGVPPEEETTQVYQAIKEKRDLPPPLDRFATPVSAQTATRKHNLPVQPTPFVGREAELAELGRLLADPDVRLVTILGAGGMGKTRLALEAAAARIDTFAHGVFFVSLAPLQSVEAIVPTVAQALSFSFYGEGEPQQQLLDYLRQKTMLLIMDSFEHLLDGVGWVTDVLKTAPDVKILATSRARLNVQGEHLFPIAGMDLPDWETAEDAAFRQAQDAAQYSAVELFLTSARRAQPGFELTADNLTDVVRICRQVQGMPLGILLAAVWVGMLTPAEIVTRIGQSFDFLETDWRDVPARQRSIRAVFDHSWNLLTEREREVFQGLSVFRGGFTRPAAGRVTGASLRELMSLVNKSLLHRTPAPSATLGTGRTGGRYEVHELLRQYAAEKLETLGGTHAARDAHSAYYAEFLHQREADLKGRRQLGALDEIEADFENARVAWAWTVQKRDYAAINRALESLSLFCMYRSRDQEGRRLFRQAREQLAPGPGDEPHPAWGRILVQEFYLSPHEVDRAEVERSLAIAQKHGDRAGIALCLHTLGGVASNADDNAQALSFYEESLAHYRALDDSFNIAATLYKLAQTYRLLGQPDKAIEFARYSLDLSREIGDKFWAASSLANTGVIAFFTGNYSEAEAYIREANTIHSELGYKTGIAGSSAILAGLAFIRGDFEEAKTLLEEALAIATDIGNRRIFQSWPFWCQLQVTLNELPGRMVETHLDEVEHPVEKEPVIITDITDIPTRIDQYEVKRLLGAGSIGAVYLAHDPDSGRDVAIKVANPEALKQFDWVPKHFKREAEILAKLAHPAIPEFYGYIGAADHTYVVIEFIHGQDLQVMLEKQEGFLPEKDVVEWAIQVCDGLTYLHSQRPQPIIFRDIKPSNVMVDHHGQVRLIDLGITVDYQPGREQAAMGTEGYSPPEQYLGYTDARSDVYALGATLHHLLTRRDPRKEMLFSFHDAPPCSLNPAIPEELEAVILKAVEHHPEDRYQSIEAMKTALLACL